MSISTCLWFQGDLEGALERYTSLFPDCEVHSLQLPRASDGDEPRASDAGELSEEAGPSDGPGAVGLAEWTMFGARFRAICAPSEFGFTEAMSLSVSCADQAEVDRYWDGLLEDGGIESVCGWLKDPWGVSWQIVPVRLYELLSDPDPRRATAAREQLLRQRRIVVAELEAAADQAGGA